MLAKYYYDKLKQNKQCTQPNHIETPPTDGKIIYLVKPTLPLQ